MSKPSQGALFRQALASEQPLQIMGAINAYCAMMAKRAGFKAIYLSGWQVAHDGSKPTLNSVYQSEVSVVRVTDAHRNPV